MDSQDLVTGIRWDLLRLISKEPQTGAALARATKTSPANVSQHLKLLEIAGMVKRERVGGKAVNYALSQPLALVTLLTDMPRREVLPLSDIKALELQLFLDPKPRSNYLRRFLCQYEEIVKTFTAFGTIKEGDDLQLFVIADEVKSLRKEHANITIGDRKIIIWSHTPTEVNDGLARGEQYFKDLCKNVTIIYDPEAVLSKLKEAGK